MKLKEVVSDADDITDARKLASAGVLGAVLRDRQPLLVAATKPGQLPYYDGARAGVALVAVPISEGSHLRGVLAADRDAAFSENDRDLLAEASTQVLRVVQAEQVFRAVERAKYEHERFFQATALLGRALTPEQVMETAFDACDAIVEHDLAAIALYDKERTRHKVERRARQGWRATRRPAPSRRARVQGQRGARIDGREEPALPAGRRRATRGHRADLHAQDQARRREVLAGAAADLRR